MPKEIKYMAQVTRVNPVVDGLVDATHPGGFFGRNVDILEVNTGANVLPSLGPEGALAAIIKVVNTKASIEVLGSVGNIFLMGDNGNVSGVGQGIRFMVSPKGVWTATDLGANIAALTTVDGVNLSSAKAFLVTTDGTAGNAKF